MNQQSLDGMLAGRLTRRATLQGVGVAGLAAALASRTPTAVFAQGATPAVATYPEVVITATDYAFDIPATIDGGWTLLTIDNQGQDLHHALFLRPTGDATVEDIQAAMQESDPGALFELASSFGGPPSVGPGERATVAMNLAPGQYVVACAIPGADGMPHYAMGMHAAVEVTARAGNALPAVADTKVTLVDFGFDSLPSDAPSGPTSWEIFNDGDQLHEMTIFQLVAGVTFDQVMQMMAQPPTASPAASIDASPVASPAASPAAGGAPFTTVGGAAPMSSGQTVWAVMDLEAGEYFAICFQRDAATGAPHFALGMIAPFTVA
ncbi:MAG: hypothetical protein H0W06_12225 [Chloroflexia bacterium]|nr:hypothetical protein [Chloroflexia bacterium]